MNGACAWCGARDGVRLFLAGELCPSCAPAHPASTPVVRQPRGEGISGEELALRDRVYRARDAQKRRSRR